MVYLTTFLGSFHFSRPLRDTEMKYLNAFCGSRRMKLDVKQLEDRFDETWLPPNRGFGLDGAFFAEDLDKDDPAILDYNEPPEGVPGRYCYWSATKKKLKWNGEECFYHSVEWLQYLITEFLDEWGIGLDGAVQWQGENPTDRGTISVWRSHIHIHSDEVDSEEEM